MKRILLAAALASTAAALLATTMSASAHSVTACRASNLQGHLTGSSGAAGTLLVRLTVTNTGSSACTLYGHPGLQLIAPSGAHLRTHVVHGGFSILNRPAHLVTLAHGKQASLLVTYSDIPVNGQRTCPKGSAIDILLSSGAVRVAAQTQACSGGTLHEAAWARGKPAV